MYDGEDMKYRRVCCLPKVVPHQGWLCCPQFNLASSAETWALSCVLFLCSEIETGHVFVCVWGGGGGGGGGRGVVALVTPVYNTSGCEIDPQQCRFLFHHTTPSIPSCKIGPV